MDIVSIAQALRTTDAQTNFIFFQIWDTTEFGPGWDSNTQHSDLWANTYVILPRSAARGQLPSHVFELELWWIPSYSNRTYLALFEKINSSDIPFDRIHLVLVGTDNRKQLTWPHDGHCRWDFNLYAWMLCEPTVLPVSCSPNTWHRSSV